jgi:hypothetical protein
MVITAGCEPADNGSTPFSHPFRRKIMDTHYASKVLQKLESYRKICGSGKIHNTNTHIAVLSSYIRMQGSPRFDQDKVRRWLEDGVQDAENFLKEAV